MEDILRTLREQRSEFVGPSSNGNMSISPLSGSRGNSDGLKEAGHLVLPKIPLPRALDESSRDKEVEDAVPVQ